MNDKFFNKLNKKGIESEPNEMEFLTRCQLSDKKALEKLVRMSREAEMKARPNVSLQQLRLEEDMDNEATQHFAVTRMRALSLKIRPTMLNLVDEQEPEMPSETPLKKKAKKRKARKKKAKGESRNGVTFSHEQQSLAPVEMVGSCSWTLVPELKKKPERSLTKPAGALRSYDQKLFQKRSGHGEKN